MSKVFLKPVHQSGRVMRWSTVLPTLAEWVRGLVSGFFDSDENFRDGRLVAPKLRPFVLALIGLTVGFAVSFVGILLCYQYLTSDLSSRLSVADKVLDQALVSIEGELKNLPHDYESVSKLEAVGTFCNSDLQRGLNQAGVDSLLVSQFYIQSTNGSETQVCGGTGLGKPFWQFDHTRTGLQIVPSQSIRAKIVIGVVGPNFISVAVVNPLQLLDRLPRYHPDAELSLLTPDGRVLAALKPQTTASTAAILSLPTIASQVPATRWPVLLEGSIAHAETIKALRSQIAFWLVSTALIAGFIVLYFNRSLQKYSSRAYKLQRALKKRRFAPVVQPIINAQTGECIGMEILMRWKHPTRGLVPPAEFIDYAERSGLIVPMSDLLMRLAHQQLSEIAVANPTLYFSFNVTPAQLRLPDFSKTLLEIFDGDPIGPSRVLLELTERDLVDEQVRDALIRLRSFGFKIAIDDFGTGQSSLAVLQDLAIDKLKIDRAFVNTVSADSSAQPVLDAIIDLAHRLKIEMVAEGIETEQQQHYLTSKGVQALQGYRFARPLTPIDFHSWLSHQQKDQKTDDQNPKRENENSLEVNESIAQVLVDLQEARSELERNRWNYGKRHSQCILGNELVSWLANRYDLSRLEALKLGKRLLAKGFLVHVFEEHDLEDAPFFYRFLSLQAVQEARNIVNISNATNQQLLNWLKGHYGPKPGRRSSTFLSYRQAVRGSEVVETLMKAGQLDRAKAAAGGVQLMRAGLLKHAFDEQGFIDSRTQFYYLTLN
jgi:EAL domain-containing protein (putative c-di-GMP-specific phosphodiesterase class I)